MKILYLAAPAILVAAAAIPVAVSAGSGGDFDAVVSAVEHRYSSHAERVPMMGLVSFCAWVTTRGGVKGMRVAEFDHLSIAGDPAGLERLVRESLGSDWQPFVVDRSRRGDQSLIYVRPSGEAMRMLIADYEHGELDVVRIEINGDRLQRWIHDPEGSARHHDYGGSTPD